MSGKKTNKYFGRKTSDWNILEFLKECEEEPFDLKIDCYIKSLENISNREGDNCRREKAQALLDRYKKASIEILSLNIVINDFLSRQDSDGFLGCLLFKGF